MHYLKDNSSELWWCNSHGRKATHIDGKGEHHCDPSLGGIMLPCMCVNLTGQVEITGDNLHMNPTDKKLAKALKTP